MITQRQPEQGLSKPTVILCPQSDYKIEEIESLVYKGLDVLNLTPWGRTLIKPNVVASGRNFPNAFTRPEVTAGVARALKARRADQEVHDQNLNPMVEWAIGERCGITMPTRYAYRGAGYYPMAKKEGFKLYHFDEESQVEVDLTHPGRLRDRLFTPEPIARTDFFVNCPKFKAHPWTTVTFSLKNYIGIQDDRHRLIDHDHRLNDKILDLQYIIQPQLIVIDAITAGEGRMLTPIPFDLGHIIMGNNQVAFDAVCCHLIDVDPLSVPHIRLAYEHGFGPVELDQINIVGDLDRAKHAAQGFRVGLIRVEEYFENTSIKAYGGKPPPDGDQDYCWGGCPGALEEAIEILRLVDPKTDEKLPPVHIVFGTYDGDIDAQPGERVIFVGDCASYQGELHGELIQIEPDMRDRDEIEPREAKSDDIFVKMVKMEALLYSAKDVFKVKGCPVSVAEQVLMLVKIGKIRNPYFDPHEAIPFTSCYLSWRTRQLVKKVFGQKSHLYGDDRPQRGGAAVEYKQDT
jgi:uncharacterized protein (DUF362 family)